MLKTAVVMVSMVLAFSVVGTARAEEYFGIPVYPGAKKDAATEAVCKITDRSGKYMYCFRTADAFEKVLAFYQKQPKLKTPGATRMPSSKFAVFCPDAQAECTGFSFKGLSVIINNPWTAKANPPINEKDFENKDVIIKIINKDKLYEEFNKQQSK